MRGTDRPIGPVSTIALAILEWVCGKSQCRDRMEDRRKKGDGQVSLRGKRLGGVEGMGAEGARPVLSSRKLASADGVLHAGSCIDALIEEDALMH